MRFAVMSSMRWEDDGGLPGVPRATTGPLLEGKQAVLCSPAGVESRQALQKEPGCAASLTLAPGDPSRFLNPQDCVRIHQHGRNPIRRNCHSKHT